MKIQINATGKIVDMPLNIAQRMINKGIAHIVKEEVKPIWKPLVSETKLAFEELPEVIEENINEPETSKPIKKARKKLKKNEDNS